MKSEGRELIAISGSIKDVVEPFAQSLGFNIIIASELEIIAGHYTGKRVNQTIKDKDALLRTIVAEHHLTLEDSLGIGDTHRDISILEMLEHPIAFNPNAALYDHAAQQGWKIVIERKNMIYELSKKRDVYELESAHPIHDDANKEYVR
jgi:phosphoserine phosphatase